ncbi:hypothetical protein FQ087_02900 [Sporosarcina sp. ANT_H38]|uniref:hypothetical protein n=1 Tax=Sporosarcina sp. ANT_H38 TaxID=2597358 RepID=UPI0011F22655|nr:hypothetical protein [Sporosarcina sp. ANT_H38]KAA0965273.1 hypothetical protein FQ087_02900 [Sporosarcina sp. ANT_H38]
MNVDEIGISYSIGKNGRYKKVGFDVMEAAYNELMKNGILKRTWFVEKYPKQSKSSPCNFTTLGGLLQHFELAIYNKGVYIKK